jgi:hypothetical protein
LNNKLGHFQNKNDLNFFVSFHFHRVKNQELITLNKIKKLYTLEKWTKKRLKKYILVVLVFDTLGINDNSIMRCFERCIPSVIKSIDIIVHVLACHDKFVCHHLIWIDRGPINDKLTFNLNCFENISIQITICLLINFIGCAPDHLSLCSR